MESRHKPLLLSMGSLTLRILDSIPIGGILKNDHQEGRESMRYADVSQKERKILDLTSLTVEEFDQLVPAFEEAFQERMKEWCLDGKKRTGRKYQTYMNCPLPTPEDRLLFLTLTHKSWSREMACSTNSSTVW